MVTLRELSNIMALVAYGSDFSDSEEETETPQTNQNSAKLPTKANNHISDDDDDDAPAESASTFTILPLPKATKRKLDIPEEEEDEFLLKKETPTELPKPPPKKRVERKPVKIVLPSLSSYSEDDEDDEDNDRATTRKISNSTGLLSILPVPKNLMTRKEVTSFVPNVLNKAVPKPLPIKRPAPVAKPKPVKVPTPSYESDSDASDTEGSKVKDGIDFFSLNKEEEPLPDAPIEEVKRLVRPRASIIDNRSAFQDVASYSRSLNQPETSAQAQESEETLDKDAIMKLCGRRERKTATDMEFIDINQKEMIPDPEEWLTKALTEDAGRLTEFRRSETEPTGVQKKKHQITYLAYQAKANEIELQTKWAENKLSRRQTQSKYGF